MKKEKIEFDLDIFVKELSKFDMNYPTKEIPSFKTKKYKASREYKAKLNLADKADINYIYWKAYTGSLNKEEFSELLHNRLMDGKFTFNSDESTEGWGVWAVVKKTFSKIKNNLRYVVTKLQR